VEYNNLKLQLELIKKVNLKSIRKNYKSKNNGNARSIGTSSLKDRVL
jgi:hypothetical protein